MPLVYFSLYTHLQVLAIQQLAVCIRTDLDKSISGAGVDGTGYIEVYSNTWLWVIGAYEITRTMCEAKVCFSNGLHARLTELKKELAVIRMPFAKQELRGCKTPISGEASPTGVDVDSKDVIYTIEGKRISVRALLSCFDTVFGGITRSDILKSHQESFT
jgi:hypothetical protein